ncbi:hypothetical protein BpHYR1_051854 [Brachionus plicatilis]|uniref:Uncharacterized protein n=1 Tax=Brachionus plicatilis TaxID=10195 RepID=A0A3M7SHV8_BRAPC|nr:hypothetical protein BpHYR1_051854 [Brachionus plicatilis]
MRHVTIVEKGQNENQCSMSLKSSNYTARWMSAQLKEFILPKIINSKHANQQDISIHKKTH